MTDPFTFRQGEVKSIDGNENPNESLDRKRVMIKSIENEIIRTRDFLEHYI